MRKAVLKCGALLACLAFMALAQSATAVDLTIGSPTYVGLVNPGTPAGDQNREDYVNYLIGMTPGTTVVDAIGLNDFTRSVNVFASLPVAEFARSINAGDLTRINGNFRLTLGSANTYDYLLAKYDNETAGTLVWYIGDLGDRQFNIPAFYNGRGLSGIALFNGAVPEGGATVLLLGFALSAIELIRRRRC